VRQPPAHRGCGVCPANHLRHRGRGSATAPHPVTSRPRCSGRCMGPVLGPEAPSSPPGAPQLPEGRFTPSAFSFAVKWEAQAKLWFKLVFQAEVGRSLGELQVAMLLFYLGRREGPRAGRREELLAAGVGLAREQVGGRGSGPGCEQGRWDGVSWLCWPGAFALPVPLPPLPVPLPPLLVPLPPPPSPFSTSPSPFATPSQPLFHLSQPLFHPFPVPLPSPP